MSILKTSVKKMFLAKTALTVFLSASLAFSAKADVIFNNTSSYNDVNKLVEGISNWFLSITAGLTILFLIIGGIFYLTAAGDDKRMEEGKKIITYTIVGLVLILISYSIVTTLNSIIFD